MMQQPIKLSCALFSRGPKKEGTSKNDNDYMPPVGLKPSIEGRVKTSQIYCFLS